MIRLKKSDSRLIKPIAIGICLILFVGVTLLYTFQNESINLMNYVTVSQKMNVENEPAKTTESLNEEWNLQPLFINQEEAQKALNALETNIKDFSNYEGQLDEKGILKKALGEYLWIEMQSEKLLIYSSLQKDTNLDNEAIVNFEASVTAILNQASQEMSFFMSEVKLLDRKRIESIKEELTETDRLTLDSIYEDDSWTPNPEAERVLKILEGMSDSYENTYKDFWGRDKYEDTTNYAHFYSKNETKRATAVRNSLKRHFQNTELLASNLEGKIKYDNAYSQAYKYNTSLEMVLAEDEVEKETFESYIKATHKALPILHRWIDIKGRTLDIKRPVEFYDLHMPLAENEASLSYSEAKKQILESVKPYGKTYVAYVQEAFDKRWIDYLPREYKYDGAYTWGAYGVHPFILINYSDDLFSAETLAHEMGHAINFHMSSLKQPFLKYQNPIFKAEIASTANEVLYLESRLQVEKDSAVRKVLLSAYADLIIGTAFEQMKATEFEIKIHQAAIDGKNLDGDFLGTEWRKLNEIYYGKNYKSTDLDELGWSKLDHLYWNFYMYKYVTGLAAGHEVAHNLMSGETAFQNQYLQFLESGSENSKDSLTNINIDLSDSQVLEKLYNKLALVLDEFEKLSE